MAREKFGDVAIRKGFVEPEEVESALAAQRDTERAGHDPKPIGIVLMEMGVLGTSELITILKHLDRAKKPEPARGGL